MTLSYRTNLINSSDDMPGPGEYENVLKSLNLEKGRKIPKEERFLRSKLFEKNQSMLPGPSDLNPKHSQILPQAPVIS